ncbi:hypothetical protein ANO14919_142900 [Xylariales sp. No.14919]|nr:hypothetical protein ANO14919_142900 [Xylariales sp. No.14919]
MSIDIPATAQKYDVSAATVIQTAWPVVLGKHTATDDVVFGATLSGRNTPINGINTMIGPTLMTRLYRESIDMIPHRHYGLHNISAIGPNEKNAYWFRILLVVQQGKADSTQADDSSGTDIVSTYPITVEFMLPGKNMSSAEVKLHYDESLLTEEMAKWMRRYLESTLSCIGSADFSAPISNIKITGSAERQILVSHVQKCPEKINRCFHSLVENAYHPSTADNAIVFFTSGSTRQPKCVASRHSAVSTSMYHTAEFFRLEAGAHVFQSTSFAFDISLENICCLLLSEGYICFPGDEDRVSTAPMREMKASVVLLTASVTEAIMPDDVPSLRVLSLGGEKAIAALIARWAQRVGLIILYGPTETIGCMTFADAVQEDADPADIGHPVTGQV